MRKITRIYFEETHFAGQVSSYEERYAFDDGTCASRCTDEELEHYQLHLEEQTEMVRSLLEAKEKGHIIAEKFNKEMGWN